MRPPRIPAVVRYAVLVFALGSALACVSREPSAEQIQAVLVRKPEILYAVIEAHPAEFMAVVDRAAHASQGARQLEAARAESLRIDGDLQHPKVAVIDHRAGLGNPRAPITIVEYTDFQCPFCRKERDVLVELFKHYGDSIRLVVKQMPVTELHPHAMDGALMFEAVARQDPSAAYKLYDDLYEHQERFDSEGQHYLEQAIARLGVDVPRALRDQRGDALRAVVAADMAEGKKFGFTGTPGLLVNGVALQGAYPAPALEQLIDRQRAMRTLGLGAMPGAPR
jgi:protein-disulfide isomerase